MVYRKTHFNTRERKEMKNKNSIANKKFRKHLSEIKKSFNNENTEGCLPQDDALPVSCKKNFNSNYIGLSEDSIKNIEFYLSSKMDNIKVTAADEIDEILSKVDK